MKKNILFSLFILLVLGLSAQTDYYYLGSGKRVECKIKKDMVVFKSQPQTDIDAMVEQDIFTFAHRFDKDLVVATIDPLKSNLKILKNHRNIVDATYALECSGEIQMPNGNIFIRMKGGISPEALLDDSGLTQRVEKIELFNPYSQIYKVCLNVPLGDILQISRDLYELNQCEFVEPSFILLMKTPITHSSDTNLNRDPSPCNNTPNCYSYQWGLHNDGTYPPTIPGHSPSAIAGIDIKAEGAWSITKGDPNIKIAVLDVGIQLDHPDLESNILQSLGYDVAAYLYNAPPPFPPPAGSNTGTDDHGTICSGVIGALDNNTGIIGVAPNCKIVPVRIAFKTFAKSNEPGNEDWGDNIWKTCDEWIARGITYAYDTAKVDILNCSWGSMVSKSIIDTAITHAVKYGRNGKGCIVAAASGNGRSEDPVSFPASLPYVIAVSGIYADGFYYGSYDDSLDVVAPAVKILTTTINSTNTLINEGTSVACPHVSGIAALILSVNPNLTERQVRDIIESTAQKVRENGYDFNYDYNYDNINLHPNGSWSNYVGYGLVDAHAAVMAARCYTGLSIVHGNITQNTIWNTPVHAIGAITIPNGVTLTITSTVKFDLGSSIIIQPGGKLIIDHGTLTNACPNTMWQGIIVQGSNRYAGSVEVRNGGTIQNAIAGITVQAGAKVKTDNAQFINNRTGVKFEYLASGQTGMASSFLLTDFIKDNNFFGNPITFDAHIKAQSSGNIDIKGCTFSGTGIGYGIWATGTNLDVREYCSKSLINVGDTCLETYRTKTVFSGFNNGIYYVNWGTLPSLKVRYCDFENCYTGMYIIGTNYPELLRNTFDVTQSYGMLLRELTGYRIEGNTFKNRNHTSGNWSTGLFIENSGTAENEVYKNSFTDLYVGQNFTKQNSNQPSLTTPTGLQTLCNTFTNNQFRDILVSDGYPVPDHSAM
jgi:subtilisin family serine protease